MGTTALSLAQVKTATHILEKDILESAALLNTDLFNKLYISVLTGIEYQQSILVFHSKGGTTRRYVPGKPINSELGAIEERTLKVELAWNQYHDNIQNYREKEPFSVLGTNSTFKAPNSEFMIRNIGKNFSEDILANMVFGNKALGDDNPLGIIDGFDTQLNREIHLGKVKIIQTDPITDQPSGQETDNWEAFAKFLDGLDPRLMAKEHVIVYTSTKTKRLIQDGYMMKYKGLQTTDIAKPSFRFAGYENVELLGHPIWGIGDRLIATVPGNFEYGVDTLDKFNSVEVDHSEKDFNELIYQIQCAMGVRIKRITSNFLAVSNGSCKARKDMCGDFQQASLTVKVTGGNPGSVEISPEKADYAMNESVTMTVTPGSGKKFEKWSDGITINPRTIITKGLPEVYEALCVDSE